MTDTIDKRWAIIVVKHVIPLNDLTEHERSMGCWCKPREEEPGEVGYIVVHNAADMREEDEARR